jgi:hypothetical protein
MIRLSNSLAGVLEREYASLKKKTPTTDIFSLAALTAALSPLLTGLALVLTGLALVLTALALMLTALALMLTALVLVLTGLALVLTALAKVMENPLNRLKAVFRRLFDIQTYHLMRILV